MVEELEVDAALPRKRASFLVLRFADIIFLNRVSTGPRPSQFAADQRIAVGEAFRPSRSASACSFVVCESRRMN
jgi:hypothetical protein